MRSLCVPGHAADAVWTSWKREVVMAGRSPAAGVAPAQSHSAPAGWTRSIHTNLARLAVILAGLAMLAGPGRALAQRPLGIDVSH